MCMLSLVHLGFLGRQLKKIYNTFNKSLHSTNSSDPVGSFYIWSSYPYNVSLLVRSEKQNVYCQLDISAAILKIYMCVHQHIPRIVSVRFIYSRPIRKMLRSMQTTTCILLSVGHLGFLGRHFENIHVHRI